MIYVTHDQVEAMTMADTIVVLARRHHRADRLADRALRSAAQQVRRRFSRRAANEYAPRKDWYSGQWRLEHRRRRRPRCSRCHGRRNRDSDGSGLHRWDSARTYYPVRERFDRRNGHRNRDAWRRDDRFRQSAIRRKCDGLNSRNSKLAARSERSLFGRSAVRSRLR